MSAPFRRLATLVAALAVALAPAAADAQGRRIGLIRDAEAEALVRDYARPILKAAGLGGANIQVKIVADKTFNAFVADQRHIFINAGTLIEARTPNELIGVLAHETGHLAGNHLVQMREAIIRSQILSAIAMIGGAAAGIAGGSGGAAGAAVLGGAQIGQRSVLAYARSEETAADRAAITYLDKTGQSAKGMLDTFERLSGDQLFGSAFTDPYTLSHPLAGERIALIQDLAEKSPNFGRTDDAALSRRHDLVRAKFVAFTGSAQQTARAYPPTDDSLAAAYARAIVAFRYGDPKSAVAATDTLIKADPKNAFFHELKGQILLETGSPKRAIEPLRKAVSLAPKEGLIRVMLGHALVASDEEGNLKEAVKELTKGIGDDPDQPIGYRQLAIAHARLGDTAMADLATAQGEFASGDVKSAKQYAQRAQAKLKTGSPAWLRADDIVTYKSPSY